MGGPEAVAKQHEAGKLTARERLDLLFDPGTFVEIGLHIIFRKEISVAADPEAERARRVEEFRALINPYLAAGAAFIDDVIDPRETRPVVARAVEMGQGKKVSRPWKKHGVMPV